jgi:hypothetical protein
VRTTTPITSRKSSVQKPGFPDGFLGACTELNPVYRRLIKMALEELQFLEHQMGQLDQEIANLLGGGNFTRWKHQVYPGAP